MWTLGPANSGQLGVACLSIKSVVSHSTFFKRTDNTVRDSDSSWEECADEGPINPITEAKRLGANIGFPGKAKIARERKIETNPAGKECCTRGQSDLRPQHDQFNRNANVK